MTKQILLVCGAGASSGFMAAAARKAAKKNGVDLEIKAKSESELNDYLDATDLLLVAPHLKYMIEEVKDSCQQKGALDGKGLVAFAEELLEEGN